MSNTPNVQKFNNDNTKQISFKEKTFGIRIHTCIKIKLTEKGKYPVKNSIAIKKKYIKSENNERNFRNNEKYMQRKEQNLIKCATRFR